jgi:hypothetical protein
MLIPTTAVLWSGLHWRVLCVSTAIASMNLPTINEGQTMNSALALIEPTDSSTVDSLFKKSIREGEERLMLAVLENATEDFQKYVLANDKRGKELFEEAEAWILETNSPSFFSFENICEHLQLDPDYVRRGFMRWKASKRHGEPKHGANPSSQRKG